jgi:hypothetical protein
VNQSIPLNPIITTVIANIASTAISASPETVMPDKDFNDDDDISSADIKVGL